MTDRPELRDCPSCGEPVGRYSLSCPKCGTNWQVRFLCEYYVHGLVLLACLLLGFLGMSKACQQGWEGETNPQGEGPVDDDIGPFNDANNAERDE